ncbi:CGG triplet repeat-binding protein 1 [Rhizophagus irregularis DAOM 181602=DAOM 197198]|nr:CGG triplet repeat-binding protein 1 [Rhizophagus irregularis DAOM 181602=DAOM 197198]
MNEHPGVFREDGEIMFCNFCDLSIEWKSKSTVDGHCLSKGHIKKKQVYESNEQTKKQLTISTVNAAFESKKEYLKEGGAIPQTPILHQVHLSRVFNKYSSSLQTYFNQKPVAIIIDETTDDCSQSVVNTLFAFRQHTKLVSVDFLELFLSDSAAYMKKCFQEALKPIMPQLIHLPCYAHIINLIGDTWRTLSDFSLLKTFLSKIKETFVYTPARKGHYLSHLRMHGIEKPCKISLPNATRWNSWFKMQNKPVFPFVEGRLEQITSYLEGNPFNSAYKKFEVHISQHPACPLFRASHIFDPLYIKMEIQIGDTSRNDIHRYSVITEFGNPSDELLREWAIYCGSVGEIVEENIDLNLYWVGMQKILPILSSIALDYIWLPVSSCSVECSFSMYNNLLNNDRQKPFLRIIKAINYVVF